ncbi:tRNA uridine-5-carboxymethylaminomethyl(34) synthesis GTPase MnmE [Sphingomonas canadensis]|uniref:tRNA modification GTPase MnmE n=1 Tax=Sphingomonas canadensis TaxID=1219257 RepID=A0ABW3H156_9SPHN|nr:tRNA uridine-5-carboxymethylaminomethyl(34) synthesis GTPase MnmE [Sphingomonas canadensis]MCW3834899.1 tRNA uridine-5-carboxymethylaminomethyl(34) synthesis GTPase MnmE [Sphingomonas canadensis]
MDTIFALSSGAPPAAVAVMRLSGPRAFDSVRLLAGGLPKARHAALRVLRDPAGGGELDRALVLLFPGPATATGEDLAELHLHGGRAVVRAVERVLAGLPGLRLAEPGEFTRRALAHGRIDLSEAEGLGDLLMAETEGQRRLAMRSAEGAVRRAVEGWTERLLGISASAEAVLDHSDEDDVDEGAILARIRAAAVELGAEIGAVAARPPVERMRDGIRVVLAGPPNAGKSTLLNALAERDAAIVSPQAGTTRDRIEAPVIRGGIAWLLTDTAGLAGDTGDAIEAIGIARAREAIDGADLLLWLGDDPPPAHPHTIWIHARADAEGRGPVAAKDIPVSVHSGFGVEALWERMAEVASALIPPPDMFALNMRQRGLAEAAAESLAGAAMEADLLLVAERLRAARRAFDAITGRAGTEAMLDALFARFCIGK